MECSQAGNEIASNPGDKSTWLLREDCLVTVGCNGGGITVLLLVRKLKTRYKAGIKLPPVVKPGLGVFYTQLHLTPPTPPPVHFESDAVFVFVKVSHVTVVSYVAAPGGGGLSVR